MLSQKCFACRFKNLDQPCKHDPQILADAYVEMQAWTIQDDDIPWPWACLKQAVRSDPEFAYAAICKMVPMIETAEQANAFAAGEIEYLLHEHGDTFVDRIEEYPRRSDRFAYILSGVWPPQDDTFDLWKRIAVIQSRGPHMDKGDPFPAS